MDTIAFPITVSDPKDTFVIGRNGIWKVQGVEVMSLPNETVELRPVGKNGILNAGFSLPIGDMDRLCTTWLKERGKL